MRIGWDWLGIGLHRYDDRITCWVLNIGLWPVSLSIIRQPSIFAIAVTTPRSAVNLFFSIHGL